MIVVRSRDGVLVRLTEERWQHIVRRHPEMIDLRDQVVRTLAEPDLIQIGDIGELLAISDLGTTHLPARFMVVVYREVDNEDGFILTAYLTSRPSARRKVKWKR